MFNLLFGGYVIAIYNVFTLHMLLLYFFWILRVSLATENISDSCDLSDLRLIWLWTITDTDK